MLQCRPRCCFHCSLFSVLVLHKCQILRLQGFILLICFLKLIFDCFCILRHIFALPTKCWIFPNGYSFDTQGQYVSKQTQHHLPAPSNEILSSVASSLSQPQRPTLPSNFDTYIPCMCTYSTGQQILPILPGLTPVFYFPNHTQSFY